MVECSVVSHHLEIGIIFEHRAPHVPFALGPTNHVARAARGWLFLKYLREARARCDEKHAVWLQIDLRKIRGCASLDNHLPSLSLSSLICEMGLILIFAPEGHCVD